MCSCVSNKYLLQNLLKPSSLFKILKKSARSHAPQAVFIEKCIEDPVIAVCEQNSVDIIGPPDALSNLRPVIRHRLLNETALQQRLRELQDATQTWNHAFWSAHNTCFTKERQEFVDSQQNDGQERRQLTADEMSKFYKEFLDKNWEAHVRYNFQWYRRNFALLFLALRVQLEASLARVL